MEMLLSERLKDLMLDADIKSAKLGEIIGVSGQSVRGWCDGSQNISLCNLKKLADYFECSIDFLIGKSDIFLEYTPKVCPPFFERLRDVMAEKNKSRYRTGKESKIKDSYFTVWKKGADPRVYSLMELADYLQVSVDYLVGRDQ